MARDLIEVSNAPPVPGLVFRRFRGEADYEAIASIIGASKVVDGIERTDTVEDIATSYRHLTNCDPYQDMCFSELDGAANAYSRIWWEEQEDGARIYCSIGFIKPGFRRLGIGTAMLGWGDHRLRQIASEHPPGPKRFRSWVHGREVGTRYLLENNGYQPVTFGAEMSRSIRGELPQHPLPEGLEMRPVAPEHLRAIWEADREAFRDHWGERVKTESDWEAFLDRTHMDTNLWRIAWEGDRVVGQVRSYIDDDQNIEYHRKRGWTEDISTIKEWRARGVARALICASMVALKERGMEEVALGVHTENPTGAFQLYSGLGYQIESTTTIYEKLLSD